MSIVAFKARMLKFKIHSVRKIFNCPLLFSLSLVTLLLRPVREFLENIGHWSKGEIS